MQVWAIDKSVDKNLSGRFQRDCEGNEVWVLTYKRVWNYVNETWVEGEHVEHRDSPDYVDGSENSPFKADHDFPVFKSNTDVIVFGKARTKAKKPAKKHLCQLQIDNHINKSVVVFGDRDWVLHGGSILVTSPKPFVEKDIDYRYSAGGEKKNRYGCGIAKHSSSLLKNPVPSVFYAEQDWNTSLSNIRVAGFGCEPPHFDSRRTYAGTFDESWQKERKPLLPKDFDVRFYQTAPKDQQCAGFLAGGEKVLLSGFHHEGNLSFEIPDEQYVAIAEFSQVQTKNMNMYTLFIDTEMNRVEISYTAAFPCQGMEETLRCSRVKAVEGKNKEV